MSPNDTQKEQIFSVNDVIDRLLLVCGAKNDTDYAVLRDLPRSTVGNWRRRQSVPYAECEYMFAEFGVSLDWIMTGEGEKYRTKTQIPTDKDQMFREENKTLDQTTTQQQLKIHYLGFVLTLDDYATTALSESQQQRIEALPKEWRERIYQRLQKSLFDIILINLDNWKHQGIQDVILDRIINELAE